MISNIWKKIKVKKNLQVGSGLKTYSENLVQYKYIKNFKELLDRFN